MISQLNKHLAGLENPHTGEVVNYDGEKSLEENQLDAINMVKAVIDIVKPTNILEIGFNRGSSALTFLLSSDAKVSSIDIQEKPGSVKYLNEQFPNRFTFILGNSQELDLSDYKGVDLVFIDGDHSYEGILKDTTQVLELSPKYILYDDYEHPAHGDDVKKVVDQFPQMEFLKSYFNQALFKIVS